LADRRAWFVVLAVSAVLIFPALGSLPFIDRDEGEYATVAREMIERDDYVIPHVNGRAYYEKPALFFWLTALSFEAFGRNERAGRLPSALAGFALVLVMGWFGRRRGGDRLGLLAALFTGTSFLVVLLARAAILDMLLTLWTTLTLVLFYEGYRAPEGSGAWYFRGAWAAMGLAFLTKGPVGAAVPLLAVFPLVVLDRTVWSTVKRSEPYFGLPVFLIVAGPWYVLALLREGSRFWEGFFISQNVTRYTEVLLGHGAPLWFYLPVLVLMLWPWFFFALPPLWRGATGTRRAGRAGDDGAALDFFLAVWFLTGLVFFSLAATKQPNYILPSAPPLILLAARWWRSLEDRPSAERPRALLGLTGLIGLGLAVLMMASARLLPEAVAMAGARIVPDASEYALPADPLVLGRAAAVAGAALIAAVLAALAAGLTGRRRTALAALVLAAALWVGGTWHAVFPPVMDYLQTPARDLAFRVDREMGPADRLASFGLYKPTLWFYTGRRIERVRTTEPDRLRELMAAENPVFLLSRARLLPVLEKTPGFRRLEVRGGYVLGDNRGAGGGR